MMYTLSFPSMTARFNFLGMRRPIGGIFPSLARADIDATTTFPHFSMMFFYPQPFRSWQSQSPPCKPMALAIVDREKGVRIISSPGAMGVALPP